MFLRTVAACAIAIAWSAAIGRVGAQPNAPAVAGQEQTLSAAERERVDRAMSISTQRYDEWLGPTMGKRPGMVRITPPFWSSPASMELETQVAFELARARFARIAGSADINLFLTGVAWHLQSHVVEQLFDLAHHQPGHHAVDVRLFGDHVRWGIPSLVLPAQARDERAPPQIAHAAAAVATLENLVGWPALAAALRVMTSTAPPPLTQEAVAGVMERALGVPVAWFFDALDPAFRVNYRVAAVDTRTEACGDQVCHRVAVTVETAGQPLFADPAKSIANPVALRIEFGSAAPSTIWWSGRETTRTFAVESALAPSAVTLDPNRAVRLDENYLDHRWSAEPAHHRRPVKSLAAWVIWLQNAALTYGVLL